MTSNTEAYAQSHTLASIGLVDAVDQFVVDMQVIFLLLKPTLPVPVQHAARY